MVLRREIDSVAHERVLLCTGEKKIVWLMREFCCAPERNR